MLLGFSLPTNLPQALNKFPKWIVLKEISIRGKVFKTNNTPGVCSKDYILQPAKDNIDPWFSEQIAITSQANLQNSIQTSKGVMYRYTQFCLNEKMIFWILKHIGFQPTFYSGVYKYKYTPCVGHEYLAGKKCSLLIERTFQLTL